MKHTLILACVACVIVGGVAVFLSGIMQMDSASQQVNQSETVQFAPELEAVLSEYIHEAELIAEREAIVADIQASNESTEKLTLTEILAFDREWIGAGAASQLYQRLATVSSSKVLRDVRTESPHFTELFVSDKNGCIAGLTNRTSDYYQADEAWWVDSYNGGKGSSYHGAIEFDESSHTEAIALYVPIRSTDKKEVVGVLKAVLDLKQVGERL
jgi:hypothetical protein